MEGVQKLPLTPPPKPKASAAAPSRVKLTHGHLIAVVVSALAYGLHYLPFAPFRVVTEAGARYPVSAAIIAIVGGVLVRNVLPLPAASVESAKGLARRIIPVTIILT